MGSTDCRAVLTMSTLFPIASSSKSSNKYAPKMVRLHSTAIMESGDEQCRDSASATHLKLAAMAAILAAGAVGVCIPLVRVNRQGRLLRTDGAWFAVAKAFAAGVILATGFVHILPDAAESLADPSLPATPWSKFPFSGFAAMMAALGTLVVDFMGTRFYERRREKKAAAADDRGKAVARVTDGDGIGEGMHIVGIHAHAAEHGHGDPKHEVLQVEEEDDHSHERHIVVSQILELGIVSHSVIIGLSLGVSQNPCTIRPLIAALSFHQFFEGFALAGCIAQARFSLLKELAMACFFAITTPGGIAVGLAVASSYNPDSPTAIAVEGILDAVSAGILIYMALVDLIATDFLDRQRMNNNGLQVASYVALFSGAGLMSLLALWA